MGGWWDAKSLGPLPGIKLCTSPDLPGAQAGFAVWDWLKFVIPSMVATNNSSDLLIKHILKHSQNEIVWICLVLLWFFVHWHPILESHACCFTTGQLFMAIMIVKMLFEYWTQLELYLLDVFVKHGNLLFDQYVPATSQIWHRPAHLQGMLWCVLFSLEAYSRFVTLFSSCVICTIPQCDDTRWWNQLTSMRQSVMSWPYPEVPHLGRSRPFAKLLISPGTKRERWERPGTSPKSYAETEDSGAKHQGWDGWCHQEKHAVLQDEGHLVHIIFSWCASTCFKHNQILWPPKLETFPNGQNPGTSGSFMCSSQVFDFGPP